MIARIGFASIGNWFLPQSEENRREFGICRTSVQPIQKFLVPEDTKTRTHSTGPYYRILEFCLEPLVPYARFQGLYVKALHS